MPGGLMVALVLIETAANQRYIFASNRLRETVGASELLHRAGTRWVLEAVAEVAGISVKEPAKLGRELLAKRIEHDAVEVIVATSGKALLLVKDRQRGVDIVREVTGRALHEAPGAVVRGYVGKEFGFGEGEIDARIQEVHRGIEALRLALPAPEGRFARLPITQPCAGTGLPASLTHSLGADDEPQDISLPLAAKRAAAEDGWTRITGPLRAKRLELARNVRDLDRMVNLDKLAVVHADGNGVGAIFLAFHDLVGRACGDASDRAYVDAYRCFSDELDRATLRAFKTAARCLRPRSIGGQKILPIVPLVLGGDDLTVVMDGRRAVDFTATFLREFDGETGKGTVARIARARFGVGRLSACAGVAVVRPHFPFHAAYDLAEALGKSAKEVKRRLRITDPRNPDEKIAWPCSALDFHNLLDASGADLDRIREGLKSAETLEAEEVEVRRWARPYVVTSKDGLSSDWALRRHWDDLRTAVEQLTAASRDDPGRGALPRSQQNWLRDALFEQRAVAEARLRQIRHRYEEVRWKLVLGGEGLFFEDPGVKSEPGRATRLLDAMDLADIRGGGREAAP